MASYQLVGSYSTVQVLSPTLTNDVVYCTIQTSPSSVVASIPVQEDVFDAGQAGVELGNFADAIEQVMTSANISSAVGTQQLDSSNLLQDFVTFTVFYNPPGTTGQAVSADADVPVSMLNFSDGEIGSTLLQSADDIINGVYANLKSAAGG